MSRATPADQGESLILSLPLMLFIQRIFRLMISSLSSMVKKVLVCAAQAGTKLGETARKMGSAHSSRLLQLLKLTKGQVETTRTASSNSQTFLDSSLPRLERKSFSENVRRDEKKLDLVLDLDLTLIQSLWDRRIFRSRKAINLSG